MKRIFLHIFFILVIVQSTMNTEYCMCQWVQCTDVPSTTAFTSVIQKSNTIFFGQVNSGSHIYLSSNGGFNWTGSTGLTNGVTNLSTNGSIIFAGTIMGDVYYSYNGLIWGSTNFYYSNYNRMSVVYISGSKVFAGFESYLQNSLYSSTNNGNNWTLNSLPVKRTSSLCANSQYLFAGTLDGAKMYRSYNNGDDWQALNVSWDSTAYVVTNDNKIYAGVYLPPNNGGLYVSTNNGNNWNVLPLNQVAWCMAFSGNYLFASTIYFPNGGVYYSSNGGASWTKRNEGFPSNVSVRAIIVSNNYLIAGTSNGIYRRLISSIVDVNTKSEKMPEKFSLEQNYPNPFNPVTSIKYSIPSRLRLKTMNVKLVLYDIMGKEVTTLINEKKTQGEYEIKWDASQYSSGIYYYSLFANGNLIDTKKMILLK